MPLDPTPDSVVLYSLTSPIPNVPNALDIVSGGYVQVEMPDASGTWDVALNSDADGFTLVPSEALGIPTYAGIWMTERASLDDVTQAPSDSTVYVRDRPVPLVSGNAYVFRSRRTTDAYGESCVYYSKAVLAEADLAMYRVTLAVISNRNCYDRNLDPEG